MYLYVANIYTFCLDGSINMSRPKGYHHSEETKQKIGESGKGKHNGRPSWWKGKHLSDVTKRKISITRIKNKCGVGFKHSEETKSILSELNKGDNNHMFGKQHSKLTKQRMSQVRIGKHHTKETKERISLSGKGKVITEEQRIKQSITMKGRTTTEETKRRMSRSHKGTFSGDKNPSWSGGTSFLPYCHKFNNNLKEKIRERDNRTCQLCGTKENGRRLTVHHVHYVKSDCEPDLITLCIRCNAKVNFDRDYYEELFVNKLIERGFATSTLTTETE